MELGFTLYLRMMDCVAMPLAMVAEATQGEQQKHSGWRSELSLFS